MMIAIKYETNNVIRRSCQNIRSKNLKIYSINATKTSLNIYEKKGIGQIQ